MDGKMCALRTAGGKVGASRSAVWEDFMMSPSGCLTLMPLMQGWIFCAWLRASNMMICGSWILYGQYATAKSGVCNLITTVIYPTLYSFNTVVMIRLPLSFSPNHAILVRCFVFMALIWCLALQTWMRASWYMSVSIMLIWNWNAIWRGFSIFDYIVRIH